MQLMVRFCGEYDFLKVFLYLKNCTYDNSFVHVKKGICCIVYMNILYNTFYNYANRILGYYIALL